MRPGRFFLAFAIVLSGVAGLSAQPTTSPRAPAGEARRTEYRRRLEQFWLEAEKEPQPATLLKTVLGPDGLVGSEGPGPSITLVATSPQASRVTLAALKALQRKKRWRGKIHAAPTQGPALDPTMLAVGISDQLSRPVMSVHKPFISSLEVIELQGVPRGRDQLAAFTEISLASQLFRGADDVDFRLARLGRDNAKFSLKSYDLQSREEFLAELRESVDESKSLEFKSSAPLLEGLPRRSQTMRLRSLLMRNWPQAWAETRPLDFFQTGVPAPAPGGEVINLWISDQMAGADAAEKVYYALLELLDSTPAPPGK